MKKPMAKAKKPAAKAVAKKPMAKAKAPAKKTRRYEDGGTTAPVKRAWNGMPIEEETKPSGPIERQWNGLPAKPKPPRPKPAAPSPITSLEGRGTKSSPNPIAARREAVKKAKVESMGPPSPSKSSLAVRKEADTRARANELMDKAKVEKAKADINAPVRTTTSGYKVYKKDSDKAAEFRKKFNAAAEGAVFDFDGRKYVKKSAPKK